jgi:hopanoid biosynthesis associated protein HpnK
LALSFAAVLVRRRTGVKALIVTADDFGLSLRVNDAVERAHRQGILSTTSLMTGAPAAEDAIERARTMPALGVGLHLTLVDGRPVLPLNEVAGLVTPDGRFSSDPVRLGIALYFSPELRRQADAEISAQFERFRATGLKMDHINGHQHFHMHPVVLSAITRIAPRFGSPPVRVPLEPFGASYRANRDRAFGRLARWLFFLVQTRSMRRQLRAAGIRSNDHVFGLNDSGAMVERRMLGLIDQLPDGLSEFYCHPATQRWDGPDTLPSGYCAEEELAALLSPAVRSKLEASGLQPLSYRAAVAGLAER